MCIIRKHNQSRRLIRMFVTTQRAWCSRSHLPTTSNRWTTTIKWLFIIKTTIRIQWKTTTHTPQPTTCPRGSQSLILIVATTMTSSAISVARKSIKRLPILITNLISIIRATKQFAIKTNRSTNWRQDHQHWPWTANQYVAAREITHYTHFRRDDWMILMFEFFVPRFDWNQ